jgi:hypothetical protein
MLKRFLCICLWTVVFLLGSALLQIFAVRFWVAITCSKPSVQIAIFEGLLFIFGTLALGMVGLILGIRGKLPGTRKISK